MNIGIISKDVYGYNARVIHANASNDKLGNILVYKTPDHYDAIILKPVASGFNSQNCDKYKRIGGSSTGADRLNVPVRLVKSVWKTPIFWRPGITRAATYLWCQFYEAWKYAKYHVIVRQGNKSPWVR